MEKLEDELDKIVEVELRDASPEFWSEMKNLVNSISRKSVKKMNGESLNLTGEIYFRMKPFIEHEFIDHDIISVLYGNVFGENPQISREEFINIYHLIKREKCSYLKR